MFKNRNTYSEMSQTTEAALPATVPNSPAQGGPIRMNRQRGGQRLSRFVFTLNNWTQEEYDYLTNDLAPTVRWIIIAKEKGESGTSHLQGACIIGSQWSFSKLKTFPGLSRAHIEQMRGKPEDSLAYCSKEDENPFISGIMPHPGKRSDLAGVVAEIRTGKTLKQLAQEDEGAIAIVKFHKGLTVLRSMVRPVRSGPPIVIWLHGPTGVGKTRLAFKCGRRLARLRGGTDDDIWISSGGLRWFDGYDGQSVAIFDDFRAKHVTSFAFLLRLLDRYPVQCEFKGGFVGWTPQFLFITCPDDPDSTFVTRGLHVPEDLRQLHRRINKIIRIEELPDKHGRRDFVETIISLGREALGLPGGQPNEGTSIPEGVSSTLP